MKTLPLLLVGVLAVAACTSDKPSVHKAKAEKTAETTLTLPSYKAAHEKFMKEMPFEISEEDMAIMGAAAAKLKAAMPNPGRTVGSKAPNFSLPNAEGKPISLAEKLKEGPVILTFYRGAWCPICDIQLRTYQESLPEFKKRGAQLIAITPQQPDKSEEQLSKTPLEFEILSDVDGNVMRAYGLLYEVSPELKGLYKKFNINLEDYNGKGRWILPVTATYVIDKDGVIRAAFADTDYNKRMEPVAIVEALKTIQ